MVRLGVLLAGGRSRRMGGGDKFRRELMGTTLIERVRSRLDQQVDCLAVSAARQSWLYDLGMLVIEDEMVDAGPLGGIHSALRWAHGVLGQQATVLTVPADTPFIPNDLASRLHQARQAGAADVAVAVSAGRTHHAIALWPAGLGEDLDAWLRGQDRRSVNGFLSHYRVATAEFEGRTDPFFNVNTPEDMTKAHSLAKEVGR